MTLDPWTQLLFIAGAMVLVMHGLWLVQRRTKDAGVVDVGWALGVGLAAVFCAATGAGDPARRLILGLMLGIWGLRLGGYLLIDRVLASGEDGRYAEMRERMGARFDPFMLWFFQAQAVAVVLLGIPSAVIAAGVEPGPTALDWLAVGVFVVSKAGEALADHQLRTFKRDPKNKGLVCRRGLWAWSRHPNYFFEWLIWVSVALLASSVEGGLWMWFAPLLMLGLILFVTGIPPTEKRSLKSRGEEYRKYQREVSSFFPLPPRVRGSSRP